MASKGMLAPTQLLPADDPALVEPVPLGCIWQRCQFGALGLPRRRARAGGRERTATRWEAAPAQRGWSSRRRVVGPFKGFRQTLLMAAAQSRSRAGRPKVRNHLFDRPASDSGTTAVTSCPRRWHTSPTLRTRRRWPMPPIEAANSTRMEVEIETAGCTPHGRRGRSR